MATLAELYMGSNPDLTSGVPSGDSARAYKDYVLACTENGGNPLTFEKWIAAGKPTTCK